MPDFANYRETALESEREKSLLGLIGTGESALDIGTLDGHYARILKQRYQRVVAFDLVQRDVPGCENVAGDVRSMKMFEDDTFDLVFCAEVLEHVPEVERAAAEIKRVCRGRAVIGVPFKQDIRIGRVTCSACGKIAPPWGHINCFDEARLRSLFTGMAVESIAYTGESREHTNPIATALMDMGGNPWGVYESIQGCMHCGAKLVAPDKRSLGQKILSGIAVRMNNMQFAMTKPHGNWIHIVVAKSKVAQS